MGDSLVIIVVIVLSAVLMFVFPLVTMSDRADDVSQLTIKTETTNFVNDVLTTGTLTEAKYDKFLEALYATGNSYDVEIEWKVLDENPGKKTTLVTATEIGKNEYTSKFTSQVLELLEKDKKITLKEGDIFSVAIKNTNTTLSQQLKNFLYSVTGNDTYVLSAEQSGIVTTNGR